VSSVEQVPQETGAPGKPASPPAAIRWVRQRRPLLTALFVVAVLAVALLDGRAPADVLHPSAAAEFWLPWLLAVVGVWVRIWGAGNLRKNQEITRTGVYQMVRHPLYLGSLLMFLAFFIAVGNPWVGAGLWLAMVVLVYYPTMMDEEAHLAGLFPEQTDEYRHLPRLVPNLFRLPVALRTDRFTFRAAYANYGLRSLWFLPLLPVLLELLRWAE
jgi:protein-S-isoprenylcysteine O-methyltransferase Ste14